METTTDSKTLADALAVLKRYAGTGATNVKSAEWVELRVPEGCGTIVLRRWAWKTFTDVSASITAGGGTPGTAYVDAAALADAVKGLTGTLTLATDGEHVTITAGGATASLRARNGADFPAAHGYALRPFGLITDGERDALRGVLTAAAKGIDARAVLTGVYFDAENGEAVATDTYRMAAARIGTLHGSGIIPADVLRIANGTASGGMELHADPDGERYVLTFRIVKGTKKSPRMIAVSVFGRMVPGPFPNYGTIVAPARDDAEYTWTITDAAGTADVLAAFRNTRNVPVHFEVAGSAVKASATFPDGGGTRDAYPPIVNGGRDEVTNGAAFNPAYFVDAVKHAGDGATVGIRDGLKAAYFDGGDRYALLMPMRVS
jgi:DNA polymerase III sliding clamp (beta) subunit (PCNA family)